MSEPSDEGIGFTQEGVKRAIDDANFIAEKLGIEPDDTIIPVIQARLRRTLGMMQDAGDRDIFTQTLLAWLKAPTYRDERRHLEAHPELLDPRSDSLLDDLIAPYAGQPRQVQVLSDHLDLLRDVRTRGGTATAIREAYVNAHGGLVLDVPPWLEAIESQFRELRRAGQPDQTARVDLLRRALAHTQSEENFAPETLAELHGLLWEALDDAADVDSQQTQEEEITCLRAMLQVYTCDRYPRQYARTKSDLGVVLHSRYAHTGDLADLEQSIAAYEEAVQQTSPGSPDRPMYLNDLGTGLQDRYTRGRDLTDLERAIVAYEEAVQESPSGSPDRPMYLNNLGTGLREHYARSGELVDLERAIAVWEEAVQESPSGSPNRPTYLNNLGNRLRARYARKGELADLDQAIHPHDEAVQYTPPDSPDMPGRRNNLGNALRERYALKGDMVDLERAIAVWEKAVQQTPHGSPSWPTYVSSLGNGLRDRYASKGNLADLEPAIAIWEKAIEQVPPGSPDLPALLNNLGARLPDRYARIGVPFHLQRAIAILEKAIEQLPPGSLDLP